MIQVKLININIKYNKGDGCYKFSGMLLLILDRVENEFSWVRF